MSTLEIRNEGRVRIIALNRPQVLNAFNRAMYQEATQAVLDAGQDKSVRVIIFTGNGRLFTAGQDLTEMVGAVADGLSLFDNFIDALQDCPKPIIAAINGDGLGIGVTMLLHTDINLIAKGARLKCPFVSLGVVPEAGSSYLLPELIGPQRSAEYLYTARWMPSQEAVEAGLVLREIESSQLLNQALELAQQIAVQPPSALSGTKEMLRKSRNAAVREIREIENNEFRKRVGNAENTEAISAFLEKRKPNFAD